MAVVHRWSWICWKHKRDSSVLVVAVEKLVCKLSLIWYKRLINSRKMIYMLLNGSWLISFAQYFHILCHSYNGETLKLFRDARDDGEFCSKHFHWVWVWVCMWVCVYMCVLGLPKMWTQMMWNVSHRIYQAMKSR